jgi:prepilin-type N-terminal cleavage/methylation domain-containing protein
MIAQLPARPGMSLIELVVAMLLAAVGLVAVASAAVLAQRTLAGTATIERITREVATLMDSLAAHPYPASGERAAARLLLRWEVEPDSLGDRLRIEAEAPHGTRPVRLTFEGRHAAR